MTKPGTETPPLAFQPGSQSWQSLWDASPGHVFLLQAMEQSSSTRSARPPSVPLLRRSTRIRWLSEPPIKRGFGGNVGLGKCCSHSKLQQKT